jgi:oxalate decarboxylase family bicupin protein
MSARKTRLSKIPTPTPSCHPPTDHDKVQTFWSSFSSAHRRIQEGGWSRQVTVEDFPISKDIAAVNVRLTAGGIRELHWHNAAEWVLMLSGNARITAIDNDGKSAVKDVAKDDLWFFPTGTPHSIQGLEPDGCEFLPVKKYNEYLRDLIVNGRAKPSKIISHRIQIEQAPDAYEKFDRRIDGYTKVVIRFGKQKAA